VAIGGAVGLFFPEFESIWANSISKEENQIDTTLPIVKLIENFNCLIDSGILRYNELDSIGRSASIIYDFISFFPKSIDEFYEVLLCKELLGKSFSSYLHIVNYNDDDNLYYRKSVSFIYWFIKTYPQYSERMYECLSHDQQQRLGFRSS
jgi:hypothetical protein